MHDALLETLCRTTPRLRASSTAKCRPERRQHFATFAGPTQSQQHIRPLHEYVTARLVLEGGFAPDELRPHPPLRVVPGTNRLVYAPDQATSAEATILGGLKTKNVDIVATKTGIGPVLAIFLQRHDGCVQEPHEPP